MGYYQYAINKIFKTNCSTGFLPEGDVCYLRKGVNQSNNTLLESIADIISTSKKNNNIRRFNFNISKKLF